MTIKEQTKDLLETTRGAFQSGVAAVVDPLKEVAKDAGGIASGVVDSISTSASAPEYEDYMQAKGGSLSMKDIGLPQIYNVPSAQIMTPLEDRPQLMEKEPSNAFKDASTGFLTGGAQYIGQSVQFLQYAQDLGSQVKDPNYSAVLDPRIQDKSDDWKIKYLHRVSDSPNHDWTGKVLSDIDLYESAAQNASKAPVSYFIGAMVGGALDPAIILTLPKSILGAATVLGSIGVASTAAQAAMDPTYDLNTENATQAAMMGAGLGVLFGAGGKVFRKKEFERVMETVTNPDNTPIGLEGIKQDAGAMFNTAASKSSYNNYKVADTNVVFTFLDKATQKVSAGQRLMRNPFEGFREASQYLTQSKVFTEGQRAGTEIAPGSIIGLRNVTLADQLFTVQSVKKELFQEYAAKTPRGVTGGDLIKDAVADLTDVRKASNSAVSKMAETIDGVLGQTWKMAQDVGAIDPAAIRPKGFFPWKPDQQFLKGHYSDFITDLQHEFFVQKSAAEIKRLASKDKTINPENINLVAAKEAVFNDVLERMLNLADDRVKMIGNTDTRFTNFDELALSKEFRFKYGMQDKEALLHSYLKEVDDMVYAREVAPDGKVANRFIQSAQAEFEKRIQDIQNSKLSTSEKSKALEQLKEAFEQGKEDISFLTDLYTGDFSKNLSQTKGAKIMRGISSTLKGLASLAQLGGQLLSNLTDMAHAVVVGSKKSPLLKAINNEAKTLVNDIEFFPTKDHARRFGLMLDEFTMNTLAKEASDIEYSQMTAWEKTLNKGYQALSWVGGMTYFQNTARHISAENIMGDIATSAQKLLDGTLVQGSKEAMELASFGINKAKARELLDQITTHGEKVGDIWYARIDHWDSKIKYEMMGKLDDYINSRVIQRTNGSAPKVTYDPRLNFLFQYQGFIYSSWTKLFLPLAQKMSGMGFENSMAVATRIFTDLTIATVMGHVRHKYLSDNPDAELTPGAAATYAIERSAVLALVGFGSQLADLGGVGVSSMLGSRSSSKTAQQNVKGLMGPGVSMSLDLAWSMGKLAKGEHMTQSDYSKIKRAIPFNNLWIYNWYLTRLLKENT
jgi:hypothetical protein